MESTIFYVSHVVCKRSHDDECRHFAVIVNQNRVVIPPLAGLSSAPSVASTYRQPLLNHLMNPEHSPIEHQDQDLRTRDDPYQKFSFKEIKYLSNLLFKDRNSHGDINFL
jgi:hypothetical protein